MSWFAATWIMALAGTLAAALQQVRIGRVRHELALKKHEHSEEVRAHNVTRSTLDIATVELERAQRSAERRLRQLREDRDFALQLLDGIPDSPAARDLLRRRRERLSLPLSPDGGAKDDNSDDALPPGSATGAGVGDTE